MDTLDIAITPRDPAARRDLAAAQADIMARLHHIAGVQWRFNDPGAQAVILALPITELARVRVLLQPSYMVDANSGLHL